MFVVSNMGGGRWKEKKSLMRCVVEEEWCGRMHRVSSGTYRVIVIRPQLSRTATASKGYTSNRPCIPVLDWSICVTVSFLMIRCDSWYCTMQTRRSLLTRRPESTVLNGYRHPLMFSRPRSQCCMDRRETLTIAWFWHLGCW